MTIDEFRATLSDGQPPVGLSAALRAMWQDAVGRWEAAHEIAQGMTGTEEMTGAWIHAYLHRKEGDLGNAGYWYRRARQPFAQDSLEEEWTRIVAILLQ
jgi:hypothetical protein